MDVERVDERETVEAVPDTHPSRLSPGGTLRGVASRGRAVVLGVDVFSPSRTNPDRAD